MQLTTCSRPACQSLKSWDSPGLHVDSPLSMPVLLYIHLRCGTTHLVAGHKLQTLCGGFSDAQADTASVVYHLPTSSAPHRTCRASSLCFLFIFPPVSTPLLPRPPRPRKAHDNGYVSRITGSSRDIDARIPSLMPHALIRLYLNTKNCGSRLMSTSISFSYLLAHSTEASSPRWKPPPRTIGRSCRGYPCLSL